MKVIFNETFLSRKEIATGKEGAALLAELKNGTAETYIIELAKHNNNKYAFNADFTEGVPVTAEVANPFYKPVIKPISNVVADVSIEPTETITPQTEPIASVEQATAKQVAEVVEESKEIEPQIDFEHLYKEKCEELRNANLEIESAIAPYRDELEKLKEEVDRKSTEIAKQNRIFDLIKDTEIGRIAIKLLGE